MVLTRITSRLWHNSWSKGENPVGVCFSHGILSPLPWELNPKNYFRIFLQWENSSNAKLYLCFNIEIYLIIKLCLPANIYSFIPKLIFSHVILILSRRKIPWDFQFPQKHHLILFLNQEMITFESKNSILCFSHRKYIPWVLGFFSYFWFKE